MSIMNKLNDAQLKAAKHTVGPIYIDAGPGTGKTTTLMAHTLHLITLYPKDIDKIYVITFTRSAASHFKRVLKDNLNVKHNEHSKLPNVMTIDKLGKQLIQNLAKYTEKLSSLYNVHINFPYNLTDSTKGLTVMDDGTSKFIVKLAYRSYMGVNPKSAKISKLYKAIQNLKRNMIIYQDIIGKSKGSQMCRHAIEEKYHDWQLVYNVYKNYEHEKENESLIDYSDMAFLPVALMIKYPELKNYCKHNIKYLNIDEFQDTNFVQLILAEYLVESNHNICVVGDTDQSLYSWRGANKNIAKIFQNHYHNDNNYDNISIFTDYRSTQNIINGSNEFIKNNESHNVNKYIKASPKAKEGSKIHVYGFGDMSDEASYVINNIKKLIRDKKYNYKDMRILYRNNRYPLAIDGLQDKLKDARIPFQILKTNDFYNQKVIRDAIRILSAIVHWKKSAYVALSLNIPKCGLGIGTCQRLIHLADTHNINLIDIMLDNSKYSSLLGLSTHKQKLLYIKGLELIKTRDYMMNHSLYDSVKEAVENSGLIQHLKSKRSNRSRRALSYQARKKLSALRKLPWLCNKMMKNYPSLRSKSSIVQLSTFLNIVQQNNVATIDTSKDSVILSTIHSSKGSEAPVVFIVGTQDGEFPTDESREDKDELEEERKVFYVGMTRAENELFITHASSGKLYSRTPKIWGNDSLFIDEIPKEYTDNGKLNLNQSDTPFAIEATPYDSSINTAEFKYKQQEEKKKSLKEHQQYLDKLFGSNFTL